MHSAKPGFPDWAFVVGLGILTFAIPVGDYRAGEVTPHAALLGGLITLPVSCGTYFLARRATLRRSGLSFPRSLVIGAIVSSVLSACGLWLMLGDEMSARDLMATALSSKPISEIRPEEKALFVQFIRKDLKRNSDYQQVVSQIKPLDPPLFSNGSFRSLTTMQHEVEGVRKTVELDFVTYEGHKHDVQELRSAMMARHPAAWEAFNSRNRDREESWEEVLSLERQLLDATIDLYAFAARHPENISYQFGNLVSHNPAIWNTFAEKRKYCISLFQSLQRLLPKRRFA